MFEEITEYYTLAELLDEIENDFTSGQYDELIERLGLNGTLYVTESYHLKEHPMYCSARLGVYNHDSLTLKWFHYKGIFDQEEGTLSDITYLDSGTTVTDTARFRRCRGQRLYELTNHLGNVLAVVSDRKLPVDSTTDGRIDWYEADIVRATDYFPFGSPMPGRTFGSTSYTYGFNGMMKDDELKGDGNSYDFGARIYDPRVGRWLSLDPLSKEYPNYSDYSFIANNPIIFVDKDGRKIVWANDEESQKIKEAVLKLVDESELFAAVYNYLDGLEKEFNASENHDLIQEAVKKATGDENAEAAGMKSGNKVYFSKELSDNAAFNEEFFHLYQGQVYETDDKKPNVDAEAKLFNTAVLMEIASSNSEGSFIEKIKTTMDMGTAEEMKASLNYSGYPGFVIRTALDGSNGESLEILPDSEAQKRFNDYLENFDKDHSQLDNDPYAGGEKEASPKAFNKAVNEVEK